MPRHLAGIAAGAYTRELLVATFNAANRNGDHLVCVRTPSASDKRTYVYDTIDNAFSGTKVSHRIGVRVVDGQGYFYDRSLQNRFVPRGMNYIRIADGYHSTLNEGQYDPERLEAAFADMERRGYNTVRIFLSNMPGGLPTQGVELNPVVLDNAVDTLWRAREHGIFVIFTTEYLPNSPAYAFDMDPGIDNINGIYLAKGGVASSVLFYTQLAKGLVARRAPLDALLAYELVNELFFTNTAPPFSLTSGSVTTANGNTYDVSTAAGQRQLLEDGLLFWIDRMRAAIRAVDPTALVTVGFFQPQGPNPTRVGDDRLIETKEAIEHSTADFFDLHAYPGGELTLLQFAENYGLPAKSPKPVIMGEFGAGVAGNPTPDVAADTLVIWQAHSCQYGFGGWLLWTWDTTEFPDSWNALDGDGAIADALSPKLHPNSCPHVWNPALDWRNAPDEQNPSPDSYENAGVWSYLRSTGLVHDPSGNVPLPDYWIAAEQWNDPVFGPLIGHDSPTSPTIRMHSGGGRVNGPDAGNDAILGWTSPVTGLINISGHLTLGDPACNYLGSGIIWSIDRGSTTLYQVTVAPGDGLNFEVAANVMTGDTLYFVHDPGWDSNCDTALLSLMISE